MRTLNAHPVQPSDRSLQVACTVQLAQPSRITEAELSIDQSIDLFLGFGLASPMDCHVLTPCAPASVLEKARGWKASLDGFRAQRLERCVQRRLQSGEDAKHMLLDVAE